MGKVCVVGCTALALEDGDRAASLAGHALHEGDWLCLDGDTGEVTLGRREIIRTEPAEELAELDSWVARATPERAKSQPLLDA
jgi:pyruvate,orthophosphate dikinase